jgi:hypothetical protein
MQRQPVFHSRRAGPTLRRLAEVTDRGDPDPNPQGATSLSSAEVVLPDLGALLFPFGIERPGRTCRGADPSDPRLERCELPGVMTGRSRGLIRTAPSTYPRSPPPGARSLEESQSTSAEPSPVSPVTIARGSTRRLKSLAPASQSCVVSASLAQDVSRSRRNCFRTDDPRRPGGVGRTRRRTARCRPG